MSSSFFIGKKPKLQNAPPETLDKFRPWIKELGIVCMMAITDKGEIVAYNLSQLEDVFKQTIKG